MIFKHMGFQLQICNLVFFLLVPLSLLSERKYTILVLLFFFKTREKSQNSKSHMLHAGRKNQHKLIQEELLVAELK